MKKSKFLVLPMLTCVLAGCSNSSIVGNYVFQLGKSTGTHFGIYLNLFDEDIKSEETQEVLGKKMDFEFALSGAKNDVEPSKLPEYNALKAIGDTALFALDASNIIEEDIPEQSEIGNFSFTGYYVYDSENISKDDEGASIIPVGIVTLDIEDDHGNKIYDGDMPLPPELLEKVVYNTWNGSSFTLVVPVSFEDALLQLYWYGIDFDFNTFEFKDSEPHPIGSSPKKEDVEKINETYPDTHLGNKFRTFHKLHMELTKI